LSQVGSNQPIHLNIKKKQMKSLNVALLMFAFASTPSFAAKISKTTAKVEEPIGFGSIKLGMSQQQIESLPTDGDVYLAKEMKQQFNPDNDRTSIYTSSIAQPFINIPLDVTLSFDADDKLYKIYFDNTKSDVFYKIKSQLRAKWGEYKYKEEKKEEQCLYKNGANFKLSHLEMTSTWHPSKNQTIKVFEFVGKTCPSSLNDGIHSESFNFLTISTTLFKKTVPIPTPIKEIKSVF
jgi:hypothetical protein